MFKPVRRCPVFARIAFTFLIVAAIGGQIWQRQPAGRFGFATLGALQALCPAIQHPSEPTIADVAHMLDRAALRLILDRTSPTASRRCAEGEA